MKDIEPKRTKVKVVIISHFGYPLYNQKCKETFGGGAAVQLYLISKELSKYKHLDINILTGEYEPMYHKIETIGNIKLFKILPLKRTLVNYIRFFLNFILYLKKINPDVIIQRAASIITGLSSIYCKTFKKKFIYSVANITDVTGELEKSFIGKIYKYGLENADCVIAQSNNQIYESKKRKKVISNITLINSGYEIGNISKIKKEKILWVGRAVQWKRAEIFLELAHLFPEEKFIMICFQEYDVNYYNSILNKANKIKNLEFHEFIPFHEIDAYFKKSKIFINTSIDNEGFPNTFIQALKNKTPILSLNVDPDNFLTENQVGLSCNNDFNKLVKNLNILLRETDLYNLMSNSALNYVSKNHDIKKVTTEWIDIIFKLYNQQKI